MSNAKQTDKQTSAGNGWRPESGDVIAGEVVDLDMAQSAYGPYPVITIQPKNGDETTVHAFHGTLLTKLKQIQPQVGDRIQIKFVGIVKPDNGGREYNLYRVRSNVQRGNFWGGNEIAPANPSGFDPDDDSADAPF